MALKGPIPSHGPGRVPGPHRGAKSRNGKRTDLADVIAFHSRVAKEVPDRSLAL